MKIPPPGKNVLKHVVFHVKTLADVEEAQYTVADWAIEAAKETIPGFDRLSEDEKQKRSHEAAIARWGENAFKSLVQSLIEAKREVLRNQKGALA